MGRFRFLGSIVRMGLPRAVASGWTPEGAPTSGPGRSGGPILPQPPIIVAITAIALRGLLNLIMAKTSVDGPGVLACEVVVVHRHAPADPVKSPRACL